MAFPVQVLDFPSARQARPIDPQAGRPDVLDSVFLLK
jgi:hypothetical protein